MIGPKAYIHSTRLKSNISKIKNHVGKKNLMIVIKANAYGHGALNIASYLSKDLMNIFCVFSIDEALELRKGGIKNNILIFSKLQSEWLDLAFENDLWVNASHINDLYLLNKFYHTKGSCPKIHLKFDTGMTRLGFDMFDDDHIFQYLSEHFFLPVEGIYSHFSTADEGDLTYAKFQLKQFNRILMNSKNYTIDFKYIHCSNSGAILNLPSSMYNTVRVGMLVYGVSPSNEVSMHINVEPIMSFCGPIINIREVSANTSVSYGGKYSTKHSTNIAVIQTGFADGLPRAWYKNGYVSYKGDKYKIAGRICMDQFMVDFGSITPQIGDEVLIFGKRKKDNIPIELIAEKIGTTTYALLTSIHGRTQYIFT